MSLVGRCSKEFFGGKGGGGMTTKNAIRRARTGAVNGGGRDAGREGAGMLTCACVAVGWAGDRDA